MIQIPAPRYMVRADSGVTSTDADRFIARLAQTELSDTDRQIEKIYVWIRTKASAAALEAIKPLVSQIPQARMRLLQHATPFAKTGH